MESVTHRMIGGVALQLTHARPEFWRTFAEALLQLSSPDKTSPGDLNSPAASHRLGVHWISNVYRRLALWNPWDVAHVSQESIETVMEQLMLAVRQGALHLVFTLCCPQCAAEIGRWSSAESLIQSVEATVARVCPLCGEEAQVGSLSSPIAMERIKVFFAPTTKSATLDYPMAVSGFAPFSVTKHNPLMSNVNHVSPLEIVTRCDSLAPLYASTVIASIPYWPAAAKLPCVERRLLLPAGKYSILFPDISVSITLIVALDPDTREAAPVVRLSLSISSLLEERRQLQHNRGLPFAGDVRVDTARHGCLLLEMVNTTNVCGVVHVLPWVDTRTAWRRGQVDLSGPSNQRLFSASTLMHYIPGGLLNVEAWSSCCPPATAPSVRATTFQLPSSTITCAVNLRESMKHWNFVTARERTLCVQELLDVVVRRYHGIVVETTSAFEHMIILFRSPSFATAALLTAAQRLATCYCADDGLRFEPSPGVPFSIALEGVVHLARHAAVDDAPLPIPTASQTVQFSGPSIECARWLVNRGSLHPARESWLIAFASVANDAANNTLSGDASVRPFLNSEARDVLIDALWDALPFRFEGITVVAPSTKVSEAATSSGPHSIENVFCVIFGSAQGCLATTECLSLPTVLDPSMVDPHHVSCSDSV